MPKLGLAIVLCLAFLGSLFLVYLLKSAVGFDLIGRCSLGQAVYFVVRGQFAVRCL